LASVFHSSCVNIERTWQSGDYQLAIRQNRTGRSVIVSQQVETAEF